MRSLPLTMALLAGCGPLPVDRPHLAVEPRTLHLPGVITQTTAQGGAAQEGAAQETSAPLSLFNLGAAPLQVTALRLEGAGYRIKGCTPPLQIEPLAGCLVRVSYRFTGPAAVGLGAVVVESDDPEHPVYRVGLDSPPALPALAVSPQEIDFGAVPSGTTRERRVQVTNLGRATADGIELRWEANPSGDFAAHTSATALPPGDTAEVTVTYSPRGGDADQATLELRWSGGARRVTLAGRQDLEAPD